ncbi:MAG TPA: glycosyltransferase family 39 protein [Bryobacteraceae bacterium]|nr:glycosyltransferase family 39 protein [Bryobacteraceae bacterium]
MLSKRTPLLRSRGGLYLFLALYAVTLIVLVPVKPLWVDEIIDLGGVRDANLRGVLDFVPRNAGGVPLGYLVDFWMIRLFGYSVFIVRLPSVFFTVLTCAAVYILAWQANLRAPLLAAVLYAVSPLTMRYALEARPYALAACCSAFSTVVFLSLARKPTLGKAARYAALVALGLFTQPYSIFVPVAHMVWLVFVKRDARAVWHSGMALALASLTFLPWFLKTQTAWRGAVQSGVRFVVAGKDLLVIPHELMGTGYVGAGLTVIAIVVALGWSSLNKEEKLFWSICAAIPLILVPAADAYFGYFLAARQTIFALVPISILMAGCFDVRRWGLVLPMVLLGAMVYEDVRWVRRPGEGWQAAAAQLSAGTCTVFVPSGARTMYVFFEPQLRACDENTLTNAGAVTLALSPNQYEEVYADARRKLAQAGFRKVADLHLADPRIELYRRY